MWPNPQEQEILNGKLHFLCIDLTVSIQFIFTIFRGGSRTAATSKVELFVRERRAQSVAYSPTKLPYQAPPTQRMSKKAKIIRTVISELRLDVALQFINRSPRASEKWSDFFSIHLMPTQFLACYLLTYLFTHYG